MKKPKLDYVTQEAMKAVDAMLARVKLRVAKDGALYAELVGERVREYRRVLQRAEKVCDDIAFKHMGARWTVAMQCRDAIKALRLPPRPRGVFRAESPHGPNKPDRP